MSTRRSHSRSNKSYDDENSNNIMDPNSLTVFQRLWCVAHTLSWLHVPELARARRVNSTFLEAVDGGYVAQPFIHLVETVEMLQTKLNISRWYSHTEPHSNSWMVRMLQVLERKLPSAMNGEMRGRFDNLVESGPKATPDKFLSDFIREAVRRDDCDALRIIFTELGASKNMFMPSSSCRYRSSIFRYIGESVNALGCLAELGVADPYPAHTLGVAIVVAHCVPPGVVQKVLDKSKRIALEYESIGNLFCPYDHDFHRFEYRDFDREATALPERDSYDGSFTSSHFTEDTVASAAVRRCAYTLCHHGRDSIERKDALTILRMVIEFEREAPWREESNCVQAQRMSFLREQWQAKFISPVHLAAANRDYEALEMILNCGFAFGMSSGINEPASAGRYVHFPDPDSGNRWTYCPDGDAERQCERGFLVQSRGTALEHACFEWTRYKNKFYEANGNSDDDDDDLDSRQAVVSVVKLLLQHGAEWSGWCSNNPRRSKVFQFMPTPATILSRDPSLVGTLITLVKERGCCDVDAEADNDWSCKPWVCRRFLRDRGSRTVRRWNDSDDDDDCAAWHWDKYWHTAQHAKAGETILSNAVKGGCLQFVKTVVLDLNAQLKLPLKPVHGRVLESYFHRRRNCDVDGVSVDDDVYSDETQFYDLERVDVDDGLERREFRWETTALPRSSMMVDPATGIRTCIYDPDNENEKERRWFLTQAYDMDPTPTKEIHAWFRQHIRDPPPVPILQHEGHQQRQQQQKRQHGSSQCEEEDDDDDDESNSDEREREDEEESDDDKVEAATTTVGAEQHEATTKTSWWDSVKSVFEWRR